jgi:hypothetical protein
MLKSKLILVISTLLLITQSIAASEQKVKCEIESNNVVMFKGQCLYLSEHGGAFTLSALDKNKPLYDDITAVSIVMIKKNVTEVRGLTTQGINSRWGNAKRSQKNKACWVGSDFKICARR